MYRMDRLGRLRLALEHRTRVIKEQHVGHRLDGRRLEAEAGIEGSCFFVQGVDKESTDAGDFRRLYGPKKCIAEEIGTEPLPLPCLINS